MKYFLAILMVLLIFCSSASAQNDKDSLSKMIKSSLREALDDRSYTRIPNAEYDNIVDRKVAGSVDEKFKYIYWIFGIISTILGGLLFFSGRSLLQNAVHNKFDEEKNSFINEVKTDILADINKLQSNVESKLKEVEIKLDKANSQLVDAKKEILFIRLEKIKNEIDSKQVAEESFKSLKASLKESENLIDNALTEKIISQLSRASYYLAKETEMEKVVQTYIQNESINLNATVFINLASGFFYNYHSTHDVADREKCLEYINEALRRFAYYGEAYALKLELLMLDYSRAKDPEQKKRLLEETNDVLQLSKYHKNSVNSAKEVIARFERVNVEERERNCIRLLEENFPEDMQEIREIAMKEEPVTV